MKLINFKKIDTMKNIFGHEHNVELYDSDGNVRYTYIRTGYRVTEIHYDEFGDIERSVFNKSL